MFTITDIYPSMSNEEYHSHSEVVSSSFVKNICKHSLAKARMKTPTNAAMEFGSAFHSMMEGEESFKGDVVVGDYTTKKTKVYKELKANNPDKVVINNPEYDMINRMKESVLNDEFFNYLLNTYESYSEYSFFGNYDNILCRVRPDLFFSRISSDDKITAKGFSSEAIIDYKTCGDVTAFKYDIKKYRYDVQAVFYADFLNCDPSEFYFIAVEKTFPYATQVFNLSEQTIENARASMGLAFDKIKSNNERVDMPPVMTV